MRSNLFGVFLCSGALLGVAVGLAGCPSDPPMAVDMGSTECADTAAAGGPVLKRASKASTIAISDDDTTVAVVNTENASVSFFNAMTNAKIATVNVGKEPSSIVIAPDNTTAWVANRADATVQKISGINTAAPSTGTAIAVGSEPTGLALSPSGHRLYVAEFGESSVGLIFTSAGCRRTFAANLRNPRTLTVTNNGDANDDDETVIVPEFYGEAQPNGEGQNDGRRGKVHFFKAADGAEQGPAQLAPFVNSDAAYEPLTSPNQLYSVSVAGTRAYVSSVSASPAAPVGALKNVYAVIYVLDLATRSPVIGGNGSINLAEAVNALTPRPTPTPFFLAEVVDSAFVTNSNIGYFVSRGADVIQRVDFGNSPPSLGAPTVTKKQIDVLGTAPNNCFNPTGIVVPNNASLNKAFVNCWASRKLAVLDLTNQDVAAVVDSVSPAGLLSDVDRGRRFYFTGRGRWSGNGSGAADPTENGSAWSSCGSCHPDGLSDNMTWIFGSGPRQTTSMDGTFSHGPGAQKMRALNWTAINDELHDFESNTRGVSGGKGAITTSTTCGTLNQETRIAVPGAGLDVSASNQTAKQLQDSTTNSCVKDFDDINAWVKTIRPPRGLRFADAESVARGAVLFGATQGGCAKCHGGAGWTLSSRFYDPAGVTNTGLKTTPFAGGTQMFSAVASKNPNQLAAQSLTDDGATGAAIPPLQMSCALRNVSTFGSDALEIRFPAINPAPAMNATRAQGKGGYNVPSLYGLQLGAPYLHHGQALNLEALFTDAAWKIHWQAGNPNFLSGGDVEKDRKDLINFLRSIDASTPEQAVPQGFAGGCTCPGGATSC